VEMKNTQYPDPGLLEEVGDLNPYYLLIPDS
jgi:hypothetical protein